MGAVSGAWAHSFRQQARRVHRPQPGGLAGEERAAAGGGRGQSRAH